MEFRAQVERMYGFILNALCVKICKHYNGARRWGYVWPVSHRSGLCYCKYTDLDHNFLQLLSLSYAILYKDKEMKAFKVRGSFLASWVETIRKRACYTNPTVWLLLMNAYRETWWSLRPLAIETSDWLAMLKRSMIPHLVSAATLRGTTQLLISFQSGPPPPLNPSRCKIHVWTEC